MYIEQRNKFSVSNHFSPDSLSIERTRSWTADHRFRTSYRDMSYKVSFLHLNACRTSTRETKIKRLAIKATFQGKPLEILWARLLVKSQRNA